MANSALIDDLLKQFAENPRRVFARLANEYRKRGELDSAIEICRSHVPLQPGYISGHIVLGQALYDRGSVDEARASFETALTLDPENLIALRHMGDISQANGDVEGARGWYRQLLEIDPQNEEVSEQLASLGASAGSAQAASPSPMDEIAGWGAVTLEPIDISVGEAEEAEVAAASEPIDSDDRMEERSATVVETSDVEHDHELSGAVEVVSEASDMQDAALEVDRIFDDVLAVESSGNAVFDDADDAPVAISVEGLDVMSFGVTEDPPETTIDALPEERNDAAWHEDSSDTFATETMAELYLQQGYADRALGIYRDLAARNPEDESLRERIAELTAGESATPVVDEAAETPVRTAREFFGALAYRRAPRGESSESAAPPESESDSEESEWESSQDAGSVVESEYFASAETVAEPEYFAGPEADPFAERDSGSEAVEESEVEGVEALAEESPIQAESVDTTVVEESMDVEREASNGRPGREADSALSLDNVFRDVPGIEDSEPRNGLSFDEFFARRGNGESSQSQEGAVQSASANGAAANGDLDGEEPHDLELFHAWLDGLKG